MSANQVRLMFIPLLAALIVAGFVTTVGLLTEPAAHHFGVDIIDVAARFTWFTGGFFVGGIIAFFVFDYVSIKVVTIWGYLAAIILIGWLHTSTNFLLLPVLLLLIGTLLAIVLCGSVTVITQQWRGKTRQMILVAQDAMFNGGGIVFSAAATWFIVHQYGWSSIYLVAAGLTGIVVLLALLSSFEPVSEQDDAHQQAAAGVWNSGIILVGISLMLFMMAKISIFVWAPQFIQQTFDVGPAVGGQFMGNVFIAAFVGSLFGTWAASKIEIKYILYCLSAVSIVSVFALTVLESVDAILILGYCYGLSVSATFNSYVSFGLSFIEQPSHKNVVYLQLMSGLGSTLAPFVSSTIVETTGSIVSAMQFCFVTLLIVGGTLFACNLLHRRLQTPVLTGT